MPGRTAAARTADGTQIQLYTCNGSAAQTWTRNGQTLRALGKCLDVSGSGTADGTKIQLWTCNGTGAQNWSAGRQRLAGQRHSSKCLDVSGNNPADGTRSCTSGPATAAPTSGGPCPSSTDSAGRRP